MTAKLTICSSYFALPGGQKVYDNVDLAQTTIQSIKEKVRMQIIRYVKRSALNNRER